MPTSPRSPCSVPLCPNLRPCPVHGHATAYERSRGSAAARGYDRRHRRWRTMVLARYPICVDCQRAPSTEADHVVPLSVWASDRQRAAALLAQLLATEQGLPPGWTTPDELDPWSLENGRGRCKPCHSRKTARETR